jgi:hypothetical protein
MNERILELARQVWPDPNTSHVNHEKFAELIVRECANYITEYYPHSRYEAFYMKKHFGVKE